MFLVDVGNLHFYEKMVKRTLCLMNCKNNSMPELTAQMPKDVMDDFEMKMPYDYLQLCYYQVYNMYSPDLPSQKLPRLIKLFIKAGKKLLAVAGFHFK